MPPVKVSSSESLSREAVDGKDSKDPDWSGGRDVMSSIGGSVLGEGLLAGMLGDKNGIGELSSLRRSGSSRLDVIAVWDEVMGDSAAPDFEGPTGCGDCFALKERCFWSCLEVFAKLPALFRKRLIDMARIVATGLTRWACRLLLFVLPYPLTSTNAGVVVWLNADCA